MMKLNLTKEDAKVLRSVLLEALDEVKAEIVRTESWELKEALKLRRVALDRIVAHLEKGMPVITVA